MIAAVLLPLTRGWCRVSFLHPNSGKWPSCSGVLSRLWLFVLPSTTGHASPRPCAPVLPLFFLAAPTRRMFDEWSGYGVLNGLRRFYMRQQFPSRVPLASLSTLSTYHRDVIIRNFIIPCNSFNGILYCAFSLPMALLRLLALLSASLTSLTSFRLREAIFHSCWLT